MGNAIELYESVLQDRRLINQFNRNRWDRDGQNWGLEKQFALQILARPGEGGGPSALLKCDPESIRMAMLECAFSGLSLAPMLRRAYLIPWDGVAKFTPSYMGLLHLVHRSEVVKACQAAAVMQNDKFEVSTRDNIRSILHVEARTKRGPLTNVYTIAALHNGERLIDVVDNDYLLSCEAAAKKKNPKGGMVWRSDFRRDMEIKSGIRHGWKYWPQDREVEHAITVAERADPPDFPDAPAGKAAPDSELCVSKEQVLELEAFLSGQEVPKAAEWLKKLAESLGRSKIEHLPASRYEEAMAKLKDRFERWKATRS